MKNIGKDIGVKTLAIHGGEQPDYITGASSPNITMSSTYIVDKPVSFSVTNADENTPFIYSRWANPTAQQLENKLCLLENAERCMSFASGLAATTVALFGILSTGDHLIISNTNYPGTAEIAHKMLPKYGIEISAVDTSETSQVANAVRPNTRMIWIETPSNPLLRISDIQAIAKIAHNNQALLAVDSTFASPVATKPLQLNADLVIHSLTKYIGGHGDALGGAILGSRALLERIKESGGAHHGSVISPFNAWLIMRGAATLPIRMRSHEENAIKVTNYLHHHPRVRLTRYPGHPSHPQYDLAKQQMHNFSGMIAFQVDNPHAMADKMMKNLNIIHYAVSLGHHRSLIFLMDSKDLIESSFALEGKEKEKYSEIAGEGIFRLSIGLEDADDLIRDLDNVL